MVATGRIWRYDARNKQILLTTNCSFFMITMELKEECKQAYQNFEDVAEIVGRVSAMEFNLEGRMHGFVRRPVKMSKEEFEKLERLKKDAEPYEDKVDDLFSKLINCQCSQKLAGEKPQKCITDLDDIKKSLIRDLGDKYDWEKHFQYLERILEEEKAKRFGKPQRIADQIVIAKHEIDRKDRFAKRNLINIFGCECENKPPTY